MANFSLDDILNSDPLGLLSELKPMTPTVTTDERLVVSFEEINHFVETHGHEPTSSSDMNERRLYSRLQGLREDVNKSASLKEQDRFNLLESKVLAPLSIEDILNDDVLGLLSEDAEDIFTLKNVPKIDKNRADADFVAQRKPCKNFEDYEPLFKECQMELRSGKRKLVKFNEKFLKEGSFFILKGVMVYLEKIIDAQKDKNSKVDGRTYCIFENGMHSNMLLRSLGKGLYEDGYFVSEHEDRVLNRFNPIGSEDKEHGFIYVLQSQSVDERISTKKNLYKIGFSKEEVNKRIANAVNEPTYLMAEVTVVSVYQCFNMNPQKLEQLLHKFFAKCCLAIEVTDKFGERHTPREWFIAPLEVIDEAIRLILGGEIVHYRYDHENELIVERTDK